MSPSGRSQLSSSSASLLLFVGASGLFCTENLGEVRLVMKHEIEEVNKHFQKRPIKFNNYSKIVLRLKWTTMKENYYL